MPSWTQALRTHYRWIIVAAGGLLGCVAIGSMFSLPVLLKPIARDTGWSVTGVSSAMTIGFLAMAFMSMAWGGLSDRIGPRAVVLTGAMVPYAFGSSDGLFNLGSALSFAQLLPPGIYVAMNGRYFPWDRVRKNRKTGAFELVPAAS